MSRRDNLARKVSRTVSAQRGVENWRATCEMVAANLPAHLLPLWDKRKQYGTGSVDERTEAFLQYVHDHDSEVVAAYEEAADAKLDAMIKEYESRSAFDDGSDVPF